MDLSGLQETKLFIDGCPLPPVAGGHINHRRNILLSKGHDLLHNRDMRELHSQMTSSDPPQVFLNKISHRPTPMAKLRRRPVAVASKYAISHDDLVLPEDHVEPRRHVRAREVLCAERIAYPLYALFSIIVRHRRKLVRAVQDPRKLDREVHAQNRRCLAQTEDRRTALHPRVVGGGAPLVREVHTRPVETVRTRSKPRAAKEQGVHMARSVVTAEKYLRARRGKGGGGGSKGSRVGNGSSFRDGGGGELQEVRRRMQLQQRCDRSNKREGAADREKKHVPVVVSTTEKKQMLESFFG